MASEVKTDQSDSSAKSLEVKLMSGEVDRPFVGCHIVSFSLRWCSRLYRFCRLILVGQLGFLDSGNVDIVAVEESQQFSDFSANSVCVPLHQS